MTDIAEVAGVTSPALYRSLTASGNPEFGTILRVLNALGGGIRLEASNATR